MSFLEIKQELHDEYVREHAFPWIVGYSGGKDSTLVAHLVFELLMELPRSRRVRAVHMLANDTLVESPPIARHMIESLADIGQAASAHGLPVETAITRPAISESFWVNLIGKGYPSPNRSFRWCTDRMKVQPTSRYVKDRAQYAGQAILLLGVRRAESAARDRTAKRYDNGERLHPHPSLPRCMVFRPILEISTDEVWEYLASRLPPWGGTHDKLIRLYRNAGGGECPVVTAKDDVPSCGTASSRFGCWTCTVVDKDRSLEGFVDSGFEEYGPLLDFRDWLAEIRRLPSKRQAVRRDGKITFTSRGNHVMGPFTLQTRLEILDRLLELQDKVDLSLISDDERDLIREIWARDIATPTAPVSTVGLPKMEH